MKRWLGERREIDVLGLDTETTGLTWLKPNDGLRLVQIGDHKTGWAVPWDQWGGAAMECINAWDGQIALHNAAFDVKFMKKYAGWKVPWDRLHDTMIMSRIMRPGKAAGLKPLSVELVDPRADAGADYLKKAMSDNGWNWATVPVDLKEFWAYGALDPVLTAHLYSIFRADLAFPEVYDLEMATLRICSEMEERGARIDEEYCEQQMKRLDEFVDNSRKWGEEQLGISIGSSHQLVKYFTSQGAEITMKTPGGALSANAEQLELFLTHPNVRVSKVAEIALNARKAEKIKSSYFKTFLTENINGFVHPQINTMGAVTGRMSIRTPALQTLPKGDAVVRNAFIAREGNKLLSSDLDQVEFRLFSCFSEDAALQEAFHRADRTGSDAFTEIGRDLYNDPNMQKGDKRRGIIKTYIYSKLFGAGLDKQAKSANVSVETMKDFSVEINAKYPGMEPFQRSLIDQVGKRERVEGEGYVITPTTRRRLPIESGKGYKAVNYVIQSSAADIFKKNLVKIDAAGLGEYMLVPIHDEIVLDVPVDMVTEVQSVVKECMTTTEGWAVPLTGDISNATDRWGDRY
jgi:DNA polymerase-1